MTKRFVLFASVCALGVVSATTLNDTNTLGLPSDAEIGRSVLNEGNTARLEAVFAKADQGGTVSIAAIGGSITEGTGSYQYSNRWSEHVADWFVSKFPNATIIRTNAGIGATGSRLGSHRIVRDIAPSNPDFVTIDYSVNDQVGERGGETMEGCVRQILTLESNPALVMVSMVKQDGTNVQDEHKLVAIHYSIPQLSIKDALYPRIASGELKWTDYSDDTIHPHCFGHQYVAAVVKAYLDKCLANWRNGSRATAVDFPATPYHGMTYDRGRITRARDMQLIENAGFLPGTDRQPGSTGNAWWNGVLAGSKPGDRMAFETDAKTLSLVYWKQRADFGRVSVTVDGQKFATLDGWFSETWGGKAETVEIYRDKTGRHHVVIEVLNEKSADSTGNRFELCSVLEQYGSERPSTIASGFQGVTRHVSVDGDDSRYDGLGPVPTTTPGADGKLLGPKRTIQMAVGVAVAGDVVSVGEGEFSGVQDSWLGKTTVYIEKKRIYLRGAGKGKTVISGQKGSDAGRCLTIHAETCDGTLVEGITFRDGETDSTVDANYQNGGAVYGNNGTTYFIDCEFRDCVANRYGGAVFGAGAVLVRCLFSGNVSKLAAGGSAARGSVRGAYNCVFVRNGDMAYANSVLNACMTPGTSAGCPVVNCTFFGNPVGDIPVEACNDAAYYNCIFQNNQQQLTRSGEIAQYCATDAFKSLPDADANHNLNANDGTMVNFNYQLFSPATGDYRLTDDSCAVGSGNPAFCAATGASAKLAFVPPEYLDADYLGKPRLTDGTVSRGAIEAPAAANASAPVKVLAPMKVNGVVADGIPTSAQNKLETWVRSENYPQAVRLEPADPDREVFCFISSPTFARFPDAQGGVWHVLEPVSTLTVARPSSGFDKWVTGLNSLTKVDAAGVRWADPNLADYSAADGSEERPYKTLQEAVDAAPNFGVVKARKGTYAEGGVDNCRGAKARVAVRSKSVRIVGVEGAGKTVVVGAFHSGSQKTGPDACRGFYLENTSGDVYIGVGGFTITGCSTPAFSTAGASSDEADYAGGAVLANTAKEQLIRNQVYDCVISNNCAYSCPALFSGWAQRCVIADNRQEVLAGVNAVRGAACRYAVLSSCLLYGNAANGFVATVGNNSMVFNCTMDEGSAIRATDDSSKVRLNTIFYGCSTGNPDGYPTTKYAFGNVCYQGSYPANPGWATVVDPYFANAAAHDYRLASLSPALKAGAVGDKAYSFSRYSVGTLEGGAPVVGSDGSIMAGCCGEIAAVMTVDGEGVAPVGIVVADLEGYFTVSASEERPLVGFRMNGGEILPGAGRSYRWTMPTPTADAVTISAVYGTDWYVDANAANDGGDGFTPATAKKTLVAIMGCDIRSGDTVHAASGDYNGGQMQNTTAYITTATGHQSIPSRVVVPEGVTLVADEGRAVTTIWGRWHSENTRQGDNALRAVYLHRGAVLDGFTVRDGATRATGGGVYEDNAGGCIVAPQAWSSTVSATIRNCEIFNGGARNAGGVFGGILDHCYLHDNTSSSDASASMYSRLNHTIVNNTDRTALASHCGVYSSVIYSSTTCGENELTLGDGVAGIENSVIVVPHTAKMSVKNMHNCLYSTGDNVKYDEATCSNITPCDSLVGVLDDAFRPVKGSPVIDAGDNALFFARFDSSVADFGGNSRISNGTIDIGAYEYQWKPIVNVNQTGTGVTEPADGTEGAVGEPLTIRVDSSRPVTSFSVSTNGVQVDVQGAIAYVWTPSKVSDCLSVSVSYGTDWYVDASAANDDGNGFTPATAKKTLRGIMTCPGLLAGDTVHAAAGDYNQGVMTNTVNNIEKVDSHGLLPSRVVIPAGVKLVAAGSVDETTISGNWHDESTRQGENAIRAVYMGAGSVVEGFTIAYGSTYDFGGGAFEGNAGGSVCAPKYNASNPAIIRNCVITDGGARNAAGVWGGLIDHCTITRCVVGSDGTCSFYSRIENSVLDGNGKAAVEYFYGIYNSTVYSTGTSVSSDRDLNAANDSAAIENSIIFPGTASSAIATASVLKNVKNCIFRSRNGKIGTKASVLIDDATSSNVITNNDIAAVLNTETWTPFEGSPAVDAGDNALLANLLGDSTTDCALKDRVSNAIVDIGAFEFDWMPIYSQELNRRGWALVTAIDGDVKSANGKLTIANGGSVTVTVQDGVPTEAIAVCAEVAGSGRFVVKLNGATAGEMTSISRGVDFESLKAGDVLTLTCEGSETTATMGGVVLAGGSFFVVQ